MNDERLSELQEKYKRRNLLEELAWGIYFNHSGYTSKQNGEFLNWLCLMAYKALKERPQGEWIIVKDEKYGDNVKCPFCGKELAGTDLNFCCKCGAELSGSEKMNGG